MYLIHGVFLLIENADTDSAHSLLLSKQMKELKDENEVMKTSVHRLNVELSNHQARQIPLTVEQVGCTSAFV